MAQNSGLHLNELSATLGSSCLFNGNKNDRMMILLTTIAGAFLATFVRIGLLGHLVVV